MSDIKVSTSQKASEQRWLPIDVRESSLYPGMLSRYAKPTVSIAVTNIFAVSRQFGADRSIIGRLELSYRLHDKNNNMHMDVSGALQLLGIASLFWRRTFPLCLYSAMTQYTIQIQRHSHKYVVLHN